MNDRSLNLERIEGVEETILELYPAVQNASLQRRHRAIQEGVWQSPSALAGEPGRQATRPSDAR